uniref:Protein kinase domain-containing protein n=1 Tax=Hyaloperonospora arabidopsidis (strain Emoy2) TaxID=559515 RepID=M4BI37_HYAAE
METKCLVFRMLLLLVALEGVSLAVNFDNLTLSLRMAQLVHLGIESPKLELKTAVPIEVQYLLNQKDLAWKDLGGTLQRLLLWDHGYVATDSYTAREVKVRCDLAMDDVTLSRNEFERLHDCPSTVCSDPVCSGAVRRATVCADSQIEQVAKCVVLELESEVAAASLAVETKVIWSEEGCNTDVPIPTLRRHSVGTFAIMMQTPVSEEACTHQLALVIPCTVKSSTNSSEWCKPRRSGVVAELLQDLVDMRQPNEVLHTGSTGILVGIYVAAAALAVVLCSLGLVCFRHTNSMRRKQLRAMLDDSEKSTFDPCTLTPRGIFFVNASSNNGTSEPMSSELFDRESSFESRARRRSLNATASMEVDYSDALGASEVLLQFQNDAVVHALRVPIIDVDSDRMLSRGPCNKVLVGTLDSRGVVLKRLRGSKRNNTLAVERLAREICLAAKLKHPNIVNLVGIAWNSLQNLMAIWEYHRSGDLHRDMGSERKRRAWTWTQQKLQIAIGISRGMSFLHGQSPPIVHGAIEPRHILLNSATGDPVLCGLGSCASRPFDATYEDEGSAAEKGSIWNDPDVFTERGFSQSSDVYSFGVLLVALDTGRPLIGIARADLLKLLTPSCPEFIQEMARDCLQSDPMRRPFARVVLRRLEKVCNRSSISS